MKICIYNSLKFHYEMFGYIISFCNKYNYLCVIYTPTINNYGWIDFYKNNFSSFELKDELLFYNEYNNYDYIFITTDDDKFKYDIKINKKFIFINHLNKYRRSINDINNSNFLGIRPFNNYFLQSNWALPIVNLKKITPDYKLSLIQNNKNINITIIGGDGNSPTNLYNVKLFNRLKCSDNETLIFNFISRKINKSYTKDFINKNINFYESISAIEIINILLYSDYIFVDNTNNMDHINGISMSGSIPLSFATLTPLIISNINNKFYNFKNVIEFNYYSDSDIILSKNNHVIFNKIYEEKQILCNMFETYIFDIMKIIENPLMTALIVEPRNIDYISILINDYKEKLHKNVIFIFYCGKGLKQKWNEILEDVIIRELDVENFNTANEYSDFMKQKTLWENLYGEYVLTFQLDTYIKNEKPYDINYFIRLNQSYIGGNMNYNWNELLRENIIFNYLSFNGGLSLRKKNDMIKIIENFTPEKTCIGSKRINTDAEDVYFVLGCIKLNMKISNNIQSYFFSNHSIYTKDFFGIHKPIKELLDIIKNDNIINNPFL